MGSNFSKMELIVISKRIEVTLRTRRQTLSLYYLLVYRIGLVTTRGFRSGRGVFEGLIEGLKLARLSLSKGVHDWQLQVEQVMKAQAVRACAICVSERSESASGG